MTVYIRLKPDDLTVYGDLMLLRVKNRLLRPCFGMTPSSFFSEFLGRLTPKWLTISTDDEEDLNQIVYNIFFYRNRESLCRSVVLPFCAAEKNSSFVMHLIKVQRRIKCKLDEQRTEKRLTLALGLYSGAFVALDADCLMKVLQYC